MQLELFNTADYINNPVEHSDNQNFQDTECLSDFIFKEGNSLEDIDYENGIY